MTNNEILSLSQLVRGTNVSLFKYVIGKVKDLSLSLAIIENDKKIKLAGESVRETLKEKEPKRVEEFRKQIQPAKDEEKKALEEELDTVYNQFITGKEIQAWLKSDYEITLKTCTLNKKYVENAGFDTDQVEMLLLFTDIAELGNEEEKPEKGKMKIKK